VQQIAHKTVFPYISVINEVLRNLKYQCSQSCWMIKSIAVCNGVMNIVPKCFAVLWDIVLSVSDIVLNFSEDFP
jgi:hypothetical protein